MDKGTKRTLDLPLITSGVNKEAQQSFHGLKKQKNGTKTRSDIIEQCGSFFPQKDSK